MCNSVLDACEKAGRWQELSTLLSGLRPDVISFTCGICACEKASQWTLALQLLQISTPDDVCRSAEILET